MPIYPEAASNALFRPSDIRVNIVLTKVLPAAQRGDLAIALAQLQALRERFPGADISVLSRCPDDDAHWFEHADSVASELFPQADEPFYRRLLRFMHILFGWGGDAVLDEGRKIIESANVLVFCGGGSPGGYGFGNLLLNAWCPMRLARRSGVPIVFTGLGIVRPRGFLHNRLLSRVLNDANAVAVRDPLSFDQVQTMNPGARIGLTADWAWLLPAADRQTALSLLAGEGLPANGKLRVGVNLRSRHAIGPDGKWAGAADSAGRALLDCLSALVERLDAEVVVFSMNGPPASDDLAYARELVSGIEPKYKGRFHLLEGEHHPSKIKAMVAMMDLFIGTRLHPSLFAVSTGVPTVTVHDQGKVRGFMQQLGLEDWHLPTSGLEPEKLEQLVLDLHARGEDISAQLKSLIPEMEKAAKINLEWVSAVLTEHGGERSF